MHFTIWIEYRKKGSYIRNQMQRDFLTMYNRLEIAVLWFLLFLLIHFCAPDDCGHGHMKLPVGQNKVMHWNEFVNLYIFMYIYKCMFINKFISWYKLRNISGSASNLCCIIDALLRFCNDDWCILSQIENVVVWIQNISHLTTMCTYILISKEGCP